MFPLRQQLRIYNCPPDLPWGVTPCACLPVCLPACPSSSWLRLLLPSSSPWPRTATPPMVQHRTLRLGSGKHMHIAAAYVQACRRACCQSTHTAPGVGYVFVSGVCVDTLGLAVRPGCLVVLQLCWPGHSPCRTVSCGVSEWCSSLGVEGALGSRTVLSCLVHALHDKVL